MIDLTKEWIIKKELAGEHTFFEENGCHVTNDNGFGLMVVIDYDNKKLIQIDSYNLDYLNY